jgi:hypothetical protein
MAGTEENHKAIADEDKKGRTTRLAGVVKGTIPASEHG